MQKVCVQGLGFVGAAMAAAVAEARDDVGTPAFQVVGVDLDTPGGRARIGAINSGLFPFETADPALATAISRGHEMGNLRASADPAEYEDCDVVVVDVHLDIDFDSAPPTVNFDDFSAAIATIARRIPAGALVLIETTVPPGTTENLVAPLLRKGL